LLQARLEMLPPLVATGSIALFCTRVSEGEPSTNSFVEALGWNLESALQKKARAPGGDADPSFTEPCRKHGCICQGARVTQDKPHNPGHHTAASGEAAITLSAELETLLRTADNFEEASSRKEMECFGSNSGRLPTHAIPPEEFMSTSKSIALFDDFAQQTRCERPKQGPHD
jgi:hypothetical protein